MSCSLRPLACSGAVEDCAEAGLIRAIFKTLKVMNLENIRARVFESDKSVFMNVMNSIVKISGTSYVFI